MYILEARNINKHFYEPVDFHVLKDISFKIRKGEFVSIMGKSGLLFLKREISSKPSIGTIRISVSNKSKDCTCSTSIALRDEAEYVTLWPARSRCTMIRSASSILSSTKSILAIDRQHESIRYFSRADNAISKSFLANPKRTC
mgnify:CR=1 FL=1